ncbi:hypothetical protein BJF91_15090 [Allorhizobium taibaishanense]|nr:hypothetical protein BJF91_15090 [Allorhizobium taibaishanense]
MANPPWAAWAGHRTLQLKGAAFISLQKTVRINDGLTCAIGRQQLLFSGKIMIDSRDINERHSRLCQPKLPQPVIAMKRG